MRIYALTETIVALIHRRQSLMHRVAARIEPAIDREAMPFGDVHRVGSRRRLAGLQRRERRGIDCALFGLERLPIVWRVGLGSFLHPSVRFGVTPPLSRFFFVTRRV